MNLQLNNRTSHMSGGHATTWHLGKFVNARLGNYGPAFDSVWLMLLYPSRSRAAQSLDGSARELRKLVQQAPKITLQRARRRIKVDFVVRGVTAKAIFADAELSPPRFAALQTAVCAALELLRPKLRGEKDFDAERFLADALAAVNACPAPV